MTPAKIPDSARDFVHHAVGTRGQFLLGDSATLHTRRTLVDRIVDRAERLSKRRKLTGDTEEALAQQIYGSSMLWLLWLWQYRELIWQVIRLLARLAHREREIDRAGM